MTSLNLALIGMALGGLAVGGGCLILVNCQCKILSKIGRRLFIATLLILGAVGLIAAVALAEGLVPLGLLAGLLVVAMLVEWPSVEHSPAP